MADVLSPGQVFAGRYRIEKFLAKGGFGAVYVAEQTETELRVALKVLWPHVLHSKDAVEKFKLEARVAGRVGSEHIVRVFDAGFDEPTAMPFLVMELLHGEDLQRVVEKAGPLRFEVMITHLRQIASALDRAHGYMDREGQRRPIVHRDLKPENLFLTHRETGEPVVKVLDFGIAKVLNDSTNVSQDLKGTPLYMAFEQAAAGKITPQTDIWALGLIAFFLHTGKVYWKTANLEEASMTQLFAEVLSLPLDAPSVRASEFGATVVPTGGFDRWFARCVNRDPAERFGTAGECIAALAASLGAPETRLSPGGLQAGAFDATAAVAAPSVAATGAARTVASGGVASGVSAVSGTAGSMAMGRTAGIEPRGRRPAVTVALGVALLGAGAGISYLALRSPPAIGPDGAASGVAQSPPEVAPTQSAVAIEPRAASAVPAPVPAPSATTSAMAGGTGGRRGFNLPVQRSSGGSQGRPPVATGQVTPVTTVPVVDPYEGR